jgi:hypothetical protein
MAESLPQYTAAATPQYDYVPNQGYITNPDRFADPEQAEEISQAVAPTQLQEEYDNDDDEEEDEDSYDELFDDELNDQDWTESGGGGGGDFTKSYNRQRKALEATNAASAEGVVKGNKLKPKANVKARVDDQIQSLTKFAARIKLGDMESGMGGASRFVFPTFLPPPFPSLKEVLFAFLLIAHCIAYCVLCYCFVTLVLVLLLILEHCLQNHGQIRARNF